jgi:hypothetical protein
MSLPRQTAWFAAKRYGYGWGLPTRWEGWLVFALYVFSLFLAELRFRRDHAFEFGACVIVLTVVLIAICEWKSIDHGVVANAPLRALSWGDCIAVQNLYQTGSAPPRSFGLFEERA